ncbi:GIY-YIG nuclease family protein [Autumnicola edwardsiae]|uniref:GIY-YIG nuclease family protein n=1 Tax=Autumnicola edwardsiae TaxID=3075594 RepID=A0ABU3CR84_9FLAO|nr:GIY-YIG nuclease family protein [Zunongwangia sp. F297]MDT0648860.1 GIY-YIG nuclease family protein [Zunongwangia sp. F297]
MKLFFVYIVQCSDESFYTGVTSNLEKRLYQHNSGHYKDAYTFTRRPVKLKWYEQFTDPHQAFKLEKQLKGWSRRKKKALIEENWERLVEYSKNYTEQGKSSTGSRSQPKDSGQPLK